MNIYDTLRRIDNRHLFLYIVITIFALFYLHRKKRSMEIIVALLPIFIFLRELNIKEQKNTDQDGQDKIDSIKPHPQENLTSEENLYNFLFSVQDFYQYNPQTYEEMIDNIDNLLLIRDTIFKSADYCTQYYQIAVSKKSNALNAFQALIFSLPNDNYVIEKFNRAHKRLETLLNNYINEMYDECQRDFITKGFDVTKTIINLGPKEYNTYDDKDFTYQFY